MNKRQKLVQKQFLNNEQAIINRLDQVYGKALADIEEKISKLTFTINDLKLEYSWLDDGDPEKERIRSMIQSRIYQREYQEQLRRQVDGILQRMHVAEFTNISDYLDTCYTDGFIGSVFDMHGQGVPVIMPIDQEAMVRAVQLESKISKGLYTRLGEDVDLLRKKVTAQVSRSIATGMTYRDTAKALEGYTRIGYNNAIRIARTEGHRVQTTATMDTMEKAREKGADVLKQWDSTLDSRTRESHVAVDGEIREVDKPFSNGLDYPGDPNGSAAEVINCRCALLQRARWALDDGFTKFNGFTNQLETFDSPDDYDEFKKSFFSAENRQYMDYIQQMEDKYGTKDFPRLLDAMSEQEYKRYSELLAKNPVYNKVAVETLGVDIPTPTTMFIPANTIEEATEYARRFVRAEQTRYSGIVDYGKIDVSVANDINEALTEIFDAYDVPPLRSIQLMNMREKMWRESQAEAAYGFMTGDLYINGKWYKSPKTIAEHRKEYTDLLDLVMPKLPEVIAQYEGKTDYKSRTKLTYYQALLKSGRTNVSAVDTKGTIIHELGHMLDAEVFRFHKTGSTFDVRASMEKYADGISAYATSDSREYIAESFAAFWNGEIDILDPELVKIFRGAMKK